MRKKITAQDCVEILRSCRGRSVTAKAIGLALGTDARAVATALRAPVEDGLISCKFALGVAWYRFRSSLPPCVSVFTQAAEDADQYRSIFPYSLIARRAQSVKSMRARCLDFGSIIGTAEGEFDRNYSAFYGSPDHAVMALLMAAEVARSKWSKKK